MLTTSPPVIAARSAILAVMLFAFPASAQSLEAKLVISGLSKPVALAVPPLGTDLYVCEQHTGRVRIVRNGNVLPVPFLDLGGQVTQSPEQGLLGIAFHPDYATNRRVYVNLTDTAGRTNLWQYEAKSSNPDQADLASAQLVFGPLVHPNGNHNGGCIHFGPDKKLYLSIGDGGECCKDPFGRAQDLNQYFGKLLRFDVDLPFPHVPTDNPYVGQSGAAQHIWARGLRNPWRFSFDSLTGDLWIADVGSSEREEINFTPASSSGNENYGWNCMEGSLCTGIGTCACNGGELTMPVHEYPSYSSGGCAVIGGVVYRGNRIPELYGRYLFVDICSGAFWSLGLPGSPGAGALDHTQDVRPPSGWTVTSFGESWTGEVYMVDAFGGRIWLLDAEPGSSANFGCGINPSGSLRVLAGTPTIGGTLTLGVDNPLGTQPPGSLPFVAIGAGTLDSFPCGVLLPGWGMTGMAAPGEFLLDPSKLVQNPVTGPAWAGPGNPAAVVFTIPSDATLIGEMIYAQAFLFDVSFSVPGVWLGTTEALQLLIAP